MAKREQKEPEFLGYERKEDGKLFPPGQVPPEIYKELCSRVGNAVKEVLCQKDACKPKAG